MAGGGVTISGGEPLLQHRLQPRRCCAGRKAAGLHTALDTSGFLGDRASDELLDATDLVLLDIKSGDPATYRKVTSVDLAPDAARSPAGWPTAATGCGSASCWCPD